MSPPTAPNFCSQCGASLSPDDAFCSQCGTAVRDGAGGSSAETTASSDTASSTFTSTATASTSAGPGASGRHGRSGFRRRVEDYTVEGWEVKHDYGDRVVLVDRGFGSWGVHALLLMFTGGLGNVPYAWYHYSPNADRLELRRDGTERYVSEDDGDGDPDKSLLGNPGRLVASFLLALVGLSVLGDASGLAGFFVGVSFLAIALAVLPAVRDRLSDRESVSTFGRVRTTDEAVVNAPDAPCTACARPVGIGVERTYAEKYFVAGIPVTVDEQGANRYCRSCANGDPFTTGGVPGEAASRGSHARGVEREQ